MTPPHSDTGIIALADKKQQRQTTLRIEPELLREARFFLDEDGKSINEFVVEQLKRYVEQCRRKRSSPRVTECA
jgi:predicted HicB family RNase H-like nuclease